MAGVEEDPEERVAEVAVDDRLERAAGLADPQRAVPLGDRREVRPDEPLDVVADPVRQLGGVLDDEPGPAVERAPDPERDREPVAALDRPVARAQQAERRPRRRAVSIRWHDSGVPFQPSSATASRSRHARAAARAGAGARPSRSGTRPHSNAASWSTSLMTRRPSAGVDQQVGRVLDAARRRRSARRSSSTRNAGASIVARAGVRLPADDADPRARRRCPRRARISASGRDRSRGWLGRLRSWNRMPAHRQRARRRPCPSTRCRRGSPASPVAPTTRIASSNRGSKPVRYASVRAVLAVGVDDEAVVAAPRPSRSRSALEARGVQRRRQLGRGVGHPEVGQVDVGEARPSRVGARHRRQRSPAAATGRAWPARRARSMTNRLAVDAASTARPRRRATCTRTSASSRRAEPEVDPAELAAAWPPPTVSSRRWTVRSPTAPRPTRRSRRGSAPAGRAAAPSQLPIGAGASAVAGADVPPQLRRRRAVVDLDEVEQPVEVEVGQRGAAAAVEVDDARPPRRPRRTCRRAGRGAGCSGPSRRIVRLSPRRCPW